MKKIVSAALLALAVGGASAQVYVGGNFGVTHINADCAGTSSCDTSDTGYKISGGYKFTPNIAAEVAYADFGKVNAKLVITNVEVEVQAVILAAVLRGDLAPGLSGVARLGVASVDTQGRAWNSFASASTSETKTKAYFGLGLEYAFNKQFKGVLAADFTNSELNGETAAVRMFSAGVQYNF